jgi:secreted PhoX family phosphatase
VENESNLTPQLVDPDDLDKNFCTAPHLNDLIDARLNRRHIIKGGVGAMAVAGLGLIVGSDAAEAKDDDQDRDDDDLGGKRAKVLDFDAVGKSMTDGVVVATGYTATVLYATGDSLDVTVPEYAGNGMETTYSLRSGDHHDGMNFFGLRSRVDLAHDTRHGRGESFFRRPFSFPSAP